MKQQQRTLITTAKMVEALGGNERRALVLSQIIFWSKHSRLRDGWFWRSFAQWKEDLPWIEHHRLSDVFDYLAAKKFIQRGSETVAGKVLNTFRPTPKAFSYGETPHDPLWRIAKTPMAKRHNTRGESPLPVSRDESRDESRDDNKQLKNASAIPKTKKPSKILPPRPKNAPESPTRPLPPRLPAAEAGNGKAAPFCLTAPPPGNGHDQIQPLLNSWNRICAPAGFPKVSQVRSEKFQSQLKQRLTERTLAEWEIVFEHMTRCQFLKESFVGTLQWLAKDPDNSQKVLDGNYDDRVQTPKPIPYHRMTAVERRAWRDEQTLKRIMSQVPTDSRPN